MEHGGEVLRTSRREHVVNLLGSLAVLDWDRLGHVGTLQLQRKNLAPCLLSMPKTSDLSDAFPFCPSSPSEANAAQQFPSHSTLPLL